MSVSRLVGEKYWFKGLPFKEWRVKDDWGEKYWRKGRPSQALLPSSAASGTGEATCPPVVASAIGAHGVSGIVSPVQSSAVAAADGYAQASGTGEAAQVPAAAAATGAHGVSGTVAITRSEPVAEASGISGETYTGIGEVTQAPAVASAAGVHGVSGVAQADGAANTVLASGGHGVAGQGQVLGGAVQAGAIGAHGVSGQGAAACLPAITTADGYGLVRGVANITRLPTRMFARGTFTDPVRSRAQRYFDALPESGLNESAGNYFESRESTVLQEAALKWIKGEINKAA